jgi:hypothetical protein
VGREWGGRVERARSAVSCGCRFVPSIEVSLRFCQGPSTPRPALTKRAQKNAGRSGRDDRKNEEPASENGRYKQKSEKAGPSLHSG